MDSRHRILLAIVAVFVAKKVIWTHLIDIFKSRIKRAASLLTPARLTRIFQDRLDRMGQPEDAGRIKLSLADTQILDVAKCGDGKASTTDRVRLRVTWADNQIHEQANRVCAFPDSQNSLLFKFCLLHWVFRMGASLSVIRFVGNIAANKVVRRLNLDRIIFRCLNMYLWYFPHAPDPMYSNETRFYREVKCP